MSIPLFQVEALHKRFATREGQGVESRPVLEDIRFQVAPGEVFAVVGPSGSGKTTLLRLLNALEEPSEGEIVFQGRRLAQWPVLDLRRRIALLFQTPCMFPGSVLDNLMAPLRLRDGREARADEAWIETLLASVGLDPSVLARTAAHLSVGQQQRVAFARALMLQPSLILLDEPTASLDPTTALTFLRNLSAFSRDQGLTVMLVTHQLGHARAVADRVLLLIDGKVVCIQPVEAFFEAPGNEVAQRFINGELGGREEEPG